MCEDNGCGGPSAGRQAPRKGRAGGARAKTIPRLPGRVHYPPHACSIQCAPYIHLPSLRRYAVDDEVKYLKAAMELNRPERNTLVVSLLDVEDFSTKLATLIQEHYYRWAGGEGALCGGLP